VDVRRQYPNVYAMKLLGAEVIPVTDGTRTLKDAVNATLKYWIQNLKDTHYILGSALGPFPYPVIVRDFQSVIGREARAQILEREGRLPNHLVACVGGGSNSIGLFHPFLQDAGIRFHGAEAGGRGPAIGDNAARFGGKPQVGIVQGYKSYFLQDESGQLQNTHSVSAGLDYAGVGPELAWLHDQNVIEFAPITDVERPRCLQAPDAAGGDHPGARILPRRGQGHRTGADAAQGRDHDRQHLRTRRQGHLHHGHGTGPRKLDRFSGERGATWKIISTGRWQARQASSS